MQHTIMDVYGFLFHQLVYGYFLTSATNQNIKTKFTTKLHKKRLLREGSDIITI